MSAQARFKEATVAAGTWNGPHPPLPPADRGGRERNRKGWPAGLTGPRKEGLRVAGQQEKQQRRKEAARNTELLCSKETDCVGGSSPQTNLLFILLLWVAGPQAREVISGRDHSTLISY